MSFALHFDCIICNPSDLSVVFSPGDLNREENEINPPLHQLIQSYL